MQRMRLASAARAMDGWASSCKELKRQAAAVGRVVRRLQHRPLLAAWGAWSVNAREQGRLRGRLELTVQRMRLASAARAMDAWTSLSSFFFPSSVSCLFVKDRSFRISLFYFFSSISNVGVFFPVLEIVNSYFLKKLHFCFWRSIRSWMFILQGRFACIDRRLNLANIRACFFSLKQRCHWQMKCKSAVELRNLAFFGGRAFMLWKYTLQQETTLSKTDEKLHDEDSILTQPTARATAHAIKKQAFAGPTENEFPRTVMCPNVLAPDAWSCLVDKLIKLYPAPPRNTGGIGLRIRFSYDFFHLYFTAGFYSTLIRF